METVKLFLLAICVICVASKPAPEFGGFFDWPDNETMIENDTPLTRIVGGKEAIDGQFPYQVSIRKWMSYQHYCGGAIVSSRFILTAAHCTRGQYTHPSSLYIVVGWTGQETKGDAYSLDAIIPHPAFDLSTFTNDIALLRTEREIEFTSHVWPIGLPLKNTASNAPVLVAGWGLPSGVSNKYFQQIFQRFVLILNLQFYI